MATRAYLATAGRDKVGFSIQGYADGEPVYIGGTGGIIERNAMRYYLALKAYLDTLRCRRRNGSRRRLHAWYDMTEKISRGSCTKWKGRNISRRKRRNGGSSVSCRRL